MASWISVEDKLPEIGQGVLIHRSNKVFDEFNFAVTKFDEYGFNLSNVTHWQPLPKAPQGV